MRTIARLTGVGMLVAACSADPLASPGEMGVGRSSYDAIATAKPGGTEQVAITGQGFGEVIECSGPAACRWRFTGTASGAPLDRTVSSVVEIETSGTWDASGCQQIASGAVRFFRREGGKNSIGWRMSLSGMYCTDAAGNHSGNGTFTVEPDAPPGRYGGAVGSGAFSFSDGVGNDPGSPGPWSASLAGTAAF